MKKLNGLIASDGLAVGPLYCIMEQPEMVIPSYPILEAEVELQKSRLTEAIAKAKDELSQLISSSDNDKKETDKSGEDIINTHILMLSDTMFVDSVLSDISKNKMNAEFVLKNKLDETVQMLENSGDEYLSERAVDIQDAFESVFNTLLLKHGVKNSRFTKVPKGAIIAAKLIKPSEALLVKNAGVSGIIMEEGGITSHIAIMARAWDIPMLVGVTDCMDFARTNMPAALDADGGFVLFNPYSNLVKEYRQRIEKRNEEMRELLEAQKKYTERLSITTKDGVQVSVNANIAFPEEIENKFVTISNGIGLFRSEFLFLEDGKIPCENTQFEAYKKVVEAMGKKPVVIRTFDVGADKMIDEQENLREKNPLLGWRAVRYCIDRKDIFKTQIKAVLRAGAFGNVFLLIPMISNIEEIIYVRKIIEECKKECEANGNEIPKKINMGIMVEVPSMAIAADLYAPYVDFFSIGTNDLIQYTMAADRENTKVAYLANYFEPSILRLIKNVIDAQKFIEEQVGHLVSMCGEMASHEDAAFLLLGMGLRHFSMPAGKILKMQKFMQTVNVKDAELLYQKIKHLNSATQIREEVQKTLEKYYAKK